jgi:xanthine dehydrogenase accessory factor
MQVWQFIYDNQRSGVPVILMYVLESIGSSPGRRGFHMAVSANGQFSGTIGGGIMEHKFVEMARKLLKEGTAYAAVHRQVHDKLAVSDQSGMICSGEQTIFIYTIQEKDQQAIGGLIQSHTAGNNGCLEISKAGLTFSAHTPDRDFQYEIMNDDFRLTVKTGYRYHLHIIGGGHCAFALSKLMSSLGFHISVYEERAGLNTFEQNVYAHQKIVVKDYTALASFIPGGNQTYVAIMTMGYRTDDEALRSLIGNKYAYLGILGSRSKMEKMFTVYRQEGITEDQLSGIHSPIGLPIKSQTADEIAISIAAEIIAVKNNNQ